MNFFRPVSWDSNYWKESYGIFAALQNSEKRKTLTNSIPATLEGVRHAFFRVYGASNRSNFNRLIDEADTLKDFWPVFFETAIAPHIERLEPKELCDLCRLPSSLFFSLYKTLSSPLCVSLFKKLFSADALSEFLTNKTAVEHFRNFSGDLYRGITEKEKKELGEYLRDNLNSMGAKVLKHELSIEAYTEYLIFLRQFDTINDRFQYIMHSIKELLTVYPVPVKPEKTDELSDGDYSVLESAWTKNNERVTQFNLRKKEIEENIKKDPIFSWLLVECFTRTNNDVVDESTQRVFIKLFNDNSTGGENLFRKNLIQSLKALENIENTFAYALAKAIGIQPSELEIKLSGEELSSTKKSSLSTDSSSTLSSLTKESSPPSSPSATRTSSLSSKETVRNSPNEYLTARDPIKEVKEALKTKKIQKNDIDTNMVVIETLVNDIVDNRRWNGRMQSKGKTTEGLRDDNGTVAINYIAYYNLISGSDYKDDTQGTMKDKVDQAINAAWQEIEKLLARGDVDPNSEIFIKKLGDGIRLIVTFAIQGLFTPTSRSWASRLGNICQSEPGLSVDSRKKLFEESACLNRYVTLRNTLYAEVQNKGDLLNNTQCDRVAHKYNEWVDCCEDMMKKYPNTKFLSERMCQEVSDMKTFIETNIKKDYKTHSSFTGWQNVQPPMLAEAPSFGKASLEKNKSDSYSRSGVVKNCK